MLLSRSARTVSAIFLLATMQPCLALETDMVSNWPSNILVREMPAPTVLQHTQAKATALVELSCGADSSFYYRRDDAPTAGSLLEQPITRLNADGSETKIDLTKLSEVSGAVYVMAFALGEQGRIFSILGTEKDGTQFLAEHEAGGAVRWAARLPFRIFPGAFLAISDNEFLVAGMTITRNDLRPEPVIALVDSSGKIVRSLADVSYAAYTAKRDLGHYFNQPIALSAAETDSNGLIYLFKAAAYPKVQVLDAQGNTTRALQLTPPGENAEATQFFLDNGRIAVLYQQRLTQENGKERGRLLLATYDAVSGKPISLYVHRALGIVACINGGNATILTTTADNHFAVGRVSLNQ